MDTISPHMKDGTASTPSLSGLIILILIYGTPLLLVSTLVEYYVDGYLGSKVSHINNLRSIHF